MSTKRVLQIAEEIKNHLSVLFYTGVVTDPRLKGVVIEYVKVPPDLKQAWIYYSSSNPEIDVKDLVKAFQSAKGYFRNKIAEHLNLRWSLDLHFEYDAFSENARKIDELLNLVKAEDKG